MALVLDGAIPSWSDVVRTPVARDQLANVVPGALAFYDLPDLAAMLAPRPLTIRAAVDPAGRPASQGRIDAAYAPVKRAYRDGGAEAALALKAGPPSAGAPAPGAGRRPGRRRGAGGRAGRRHDRDGQADRRGRAPRPDPLGGPRGEGERRGQRRAGHAVVGQLQPAGPGGRGAGRLPGHGGLRRQHRRGLLGARQGRPDPALARRLALDRADDLRLPGPPALVRLQTQMANEPVYVDGGEKPDGAEDLLSQRPRHRRRRGAGRGRRGDRRRGRQPPGPPGWPGTRTPRPSRDTTSSTCSTTGGGTTATATCRRSTRRSSPGRPCGWGRRSACSARRGGAAAGRTSTSTSRAGSRRAGGGRRRGTPSSGRPYQREHKPEVVAVARPHRLIWAGEAAVLDGSKSWSRSGPIASFEWTFGDGTTATGPRVERTYDRPGSYSEVLKVTDRAGARRLRLRHRAGARPREPGPGPADDPRGVRADVRDQARRPGHVQGADLPDDRRPRDLGLRRRHPAGRRPVGRQRRSSTPRTATRSRSTASTSRAITSSASSGATATGATATARLHVIVEGDRAEASSDRR